MGGISEESSELSRQDSRKHRLKIGWVGFELARSGSCICAIVYLMVFQKGLGCLGKVRAFARTVIRGWLGWI